MPWDTHAIDSTDREEPLLRLAQHYGIQPAYADGLGRRVHAPRETVLAALRALGAPIHTERDAADALREAQDRVQRRALPRTVVVWGNREPGVPMQLPKSRIGTTIACRIAFEDGTTHAWTCAPTAHNRHDQRCVIPLQTPGDGPFPFGNHRFRLETAAGEYACRILCAPRRSWAPDGNGKRLGIFLPLYAIRTRRSLGAGDLTDLGTLTRWAHKQDVSLVGTLPLLDCYYGAGGEPLEPSPYAPISRRFWNPLFADQTGTPEFASSDSAQRLAVSKPWAQRARALRHNNYVDYRKLAATKRRMASILAANLTDERAAALGTWLTEKPERRLYARFRAATETHGPWRSWNGRMRSGDLQKNDAPAQLVHTHAYDQWIVHEQIHDAARTKNNAGMYLDLPVGSHADGFDAWRSRNIIAEGFCLGAPPDKLFPKGQAWGLGAMKPCAGSETGHESFITHMEAHAKIAAALRIDHAAGIVRSFWVPDGGDATAGVYVRQPTEELIAAMCAVSHRHRCELIGEDLGTVPENLRPALRAHGIGTMRVAQLEASQECAGGMLATTTIHQKNDKTGRELVCLNTHDTPTFAGFLRAADADDLLERGVCDTETAEELRKERRRAVECIQNALHGTLHNNETVTGHGMLAAMLASIAGAPHAIMIVNLEDLWLEPEPPNWPGPPCGKPVWRRKAAFGLEAMRARPDVRNVLRAVRDAQRSCPTNNTPGLEPNAERPR